MVVNVDRADRVLVRLVATTINGESDLASADVCTHTPPLLQAWAPGCWALVTQPAVCAVKPEVALLTSPAG